MFPCIFWVRESTPSEQPNKSLHWPLVPESASQNLVFLAFLTSVLLPIGAAELIGWRQAARDPERTFIIQAIAIVLCR